MSLEDLETNVEETAEALDGGVEVSLDGQTRDELAFLCAVLDTSPGEVLRTGVHEHLRMLLGNQVLDIHLRKKYDVTYDEYLVGQEVDEVEGVDVERTGDRGFL